MPDTWVKLCLLPGVQVARVNYGSVVARFSYLSCGAIPLMALWSGKSACPGRNLRVHVYLLVFSDPWLVKHD